MHGKICYLEIPATDVEASVRFYDTVFGWKSRSRGDGQLAFDDSTGAVSGTWVLGRPPQREAGILTYVWVDNIDETLSKISSAGGRTLAGKTAIGSSGSAFATFTDPAGNKLGLYQNH